ncbi:hypothetical protein [Pseudovibrio sp. SCP19]|uniref:hypothetical protein n=1 Tax=Pseudovibrio sp. SCP19 TaxID=3141374 RepID=UPI00333987DA
MDNARLTLNEVEKLYQQGVSKACAFVGYKQQIANVRARANELWALDRESFSETRKAEFERQQKVLEGLASKTETQLKSGDLKGGRKIWACWMPALKHWN